MGTFIEATPFTDDRDACVGDQLFYHTGCPRNSMTFHQNPATNDKTLKCDCGLELVLLSSLLAETEIHKTAIDCEPRPLDPDTFHCTAPGTVTVVATTDTQVTT